MKRERLLGLFIILLTAAIGFAGCSDDSTGHSDPPEEEAITGTWQLSSLVFSMGSGIELDVTDMDNCLLETTLTFEEDGDFHYVYSSADGEECSTGSDTGTWEHESENTYRIEADGLPIGQGTQELTFSNNNNSFSFTEQLQFNEISGAATATFDRQ